MTEIEALIERLWELDDDELEAHIGSRVQAIEDDVAGHGTRGIDPASLESIDLDVAAKASIDPRLLEAGGQLFERVNPLVYELMCNPLGGNDLEAQRILDEAINQNYIKAAGMLAPVLISGLQLAPAVATLLATLLIKKIANYTATEICKTWENNLQKPAI